MSPQFVDFNGDGHLDIVAGIFDGSPHVALGDGKHWQQPHTILDKAGQRIVLNAFWNFDKKQWDETDRCDPEGGAPARGHLTSAIARDWDHDGDHDLVLGDHASGYVYLRRNEGSNQKPMFATHNELVQADGKALHDPGTVATIRSVDWDQDGSLDLMVSGMGDPYGSKTGGGVAVYLNTAANKTTNLGPAIWLVEPSKKGAKLNPTRPDSGLHPEAIDYDGDGDLDLIVGGYSIWTPATPELTDAQQQELADLQAEREQLQADMQKRNKAMLKAQEGLDSDAARKVRMEISRDPERRKVTKRLSEVIQQINKLAPRDQRVSFTWLYENLAKKGKATEASHQR